MMQNKEVIVSNNNHVVLSTIDDVETTGWCFVKECKIHDKDDVMQNNGFVFTRKVKLIFEKNEENIA